jgi:hypothetical protein
MTLRRRDFLIGSAIGLATATSAAAQGFVDSIIAQLREQGFQTVLQERTLLGRVRITASRGGGKREIIVNPRTGEILRDLWTPGAGGSPTIEIIDDKSGKGGGGNTPDPDEDDDEDDSDDDSDGEGGGGDDGGDDGEGGGGDGEDD